MDTVTQISLGAAVGEAVLGKRIGNKAPMWGAIIGIVPDLDVFASPFVTEVEGLAIHRGITHSLFFCVLAAPLFGWLLNRYYRRLEAEWKNWTLLALLVLLTHVFIDTCTSYGTQVFQPFSNYPHSFNSIFIIDPFYTLPLAVGIFSALFFKRNANKRKWANGLGLAVSTFYLMAGFGIKSHVNAVFEQNFQKEQIHPEKYMTTPAPFSIFLWTAYAEEDDTLYAGLYSVFDDNRQVQFHPIPKNESLLAPYRDQLAVERLIWFSNGYFFAEKNTPDLIVHDLRFGRSDLWLWDEPANFVWNYRLQFNSDSTRVTGFDQLEPTFDTRDRLWGRLIGRTFGQEID